MPAFDSALQPPSSPTSPTSPPPDAAPPDAAPPDAPVSAPVTGTPASGGLRLSDGTSVRFEDGNLVVQDPSGATTSLAIDALTLGGSEDIPPEAPVLLAFSFAGLIGLIMAFPIGRAIARWIDRRGQVPPVSEDLARRLAAIEQAVDTVAVEVERMSEANRFTTKLLAERIGAPDFTARAGAPADALRADPPRRP